ncbi:MAG: MotA/TolQ/ExbB proton channel family protein [Bacteroidales bacterium]|nr:MotA/TolQ/ExbB proton channel family protein [Bacteroidales bacterium]
MSNLFSLLFDGGAFFMFPILFLLILIIVLIARGFIDVSKREKIISLISSLGLFTLVWGFLGQTIGLIQGFDSIEKVGGNISPGLIAGGLKISLLSPVFGIIVFLIARAGIIVLTWTNKNKE